MQALLTRIHHLLDELGQRPWLLLTVTLAVNSLALPYMFPFHDSVLYGLQTLNAALGGHFRDDVFFLGQAQDRLSIFTTLAAPLTRAVGLHVAFLLLYWVSVTLFYSGLYQLARLLLVEPALVAAALLLVAVTNIDYGNGLFAANEQYLTARLPACGLVLWGLAWLVTGRWLRALGVLLLGMLVHPLMAVSGLAVWGLWWVVQWRQRLVVWLALAAGVAGGVAVLVIESWGLHLFGEMDEEWKTIVRRGTPFNFPSTWPLGCALLVLTNVAVCVLAGSFLPDAATRRLVGLVVVVALAGYGLNVLAESLSYALLIQAQPYRALWLLELLAGLLTLLLLVRWWQRGPTLWRCAGVLLVLRLTLPDAGGGVLGGWLLASGLLAGLICACTDRREATFWSWALALLLLGVLAFEGYRLMRLAANWNLFMREFSPLESVQYNLYVMQPLTKFVLALGGLLIAQQVLGLGRRLAVAAACVFLLPNGVVEVCRQVQPFAAWHNDCSEVLRVAHAYCQAHANADGRPLSLYWPIGKPYFVWHRLGCTSYYQFNEQLSGLLFSRPRAIEVWRRAMLSAPFELIRMQKSKQTIWTKDNLAGVYGPDWQSLQPDPHAFWQLCRDPALDVAILPYAMEGLYEEAHDGWYFYDCRQLRAEQ
jgi:hypothetical protein